MDQKPIPVIQIVGYKNSGKTTCVTHLTQALSKKGLKIATIKHHGHGGEPSEKEDTDTFLHKQAGAKLTSVKGNKTWVLTYTDDDDIDLNHMISLYKNFPINAILIEGFKNAIYPKIVMLRENTDQSLLLDLSNVFAVGGFDEPNINTKHFSFSINNWDLYEEELIELLKGG